MSDDGRGSGSTADNPVTLEFLARQGRRVLDELATLRDGMNVLMEIVLRHEREFERLNGKLDDMLRQMTVMVASSSASAIGCSASTSVCMLSKIAKQARDDRSLPRLDRPPAASRNARFARDLDV